MNNKIKIGILGGGQLARMMTYACQKLPNIELIILDPNGKNSPAGLINNNVIEGSFKDEEKIKELSSMSDIITAEIEHINVEALKNLEAHGFNIQPSSAVFEIIQNKLTQKQYFLENNIPTTKFYEITKQNIKEIIQKLNGYPIVVKIQKEGYDGYGNVVINNENDIEKLNNLSGLLYAEEFINYQAELAVMVARDINNNIKLYPIVETVQTNNICHKVYSPPKINLSQNKIDEINKIVTRTIKCLPSGAGVFGVELFLSDKGEIILNEIAPRPHNSGHYTIEACETDQFEQHLRCITGMRIGSTKQKVGACAMYNILGQNTLDETMKLVEKYSNIDGSVIHWYHKKDNRLGRKMGHITTISDNYNNLVDKLSEIDNLTKNIEVSIIMGSKSDYDVMKRAVNILTDFGINYEILIVSAHRTPDKMYKYCQKIKERNIQVIIAGAGGSAHLPGMVSSMVDIPVIGIPVKSSYLDGHDSLLSIVQMPRGVPVATMGINNVQNGALLATRILALTNKDLQNKLNEYIKIQTNNDVEKIQIY